MKVSLQLVGNCQSSFDVSRFNADTISGLTDKIAAQLGAVDAVTDLAQKYQDSLVVKVVSCEKHPSADKLHVCKIDDGGKFENIDRDENGFVQIVCGAPNVREGLSVVWLPPGVIVPSSMDKDPFKLEAREIRGVISNGMLASASELGLSEDHTGILEVDDDIAKGSNFSEQYRLNDFIIDIENKMFTHRPDCFGHLGVSRELAGIYGQSFKSPDWYREDPGSLTVTGQPLELKITNNLTKEVPRFAAVTIANITIKPSSVQIQAYLSRLGIRPINNVVDLTNLYMVITGQPLHAYDYDKVSQLTNGQGASLSVRYPKDGEKITLLGGKEVKPSSKTIMIATDSQAIGVGGVMGGSETEVDDQTKNIILECATFNMYSIRRTSMELGVFTEAVTRFTKGQSPRQNLAVLKKVSEEICQASGGNIASDVIDDNKDLPTPPTVKLSAGFINERLGSNYSPDDIAQVLMNVEFEVTIQNDDLIVVAPFWRTDIEIPEDIIEEVGRLRGFDSLPQSLPIRSIKPAAKDPLLSLKQEIRFQLSKLGANEVLTYSFVHGDLLDRMSQDKKNAFQITNALSPNLQYYRTSLLPSLLEKVHPNIKSGYDEFGLFELNPVHNKLAIEQSSQVPIEAQHLGFVFAANSKTAKSQYEGASYYQAKQYLSTLMFSLGVSAMVEGISDPNEIPPDLKDVVAPFEPSRLSGVILPSGDLIGFIGEFKPSVKKALKLPDFVCGFEIDLGKLIGASPSRPIYQKLSKYPFVEQDICFKVANNMSYQAIIDLVWNEFSNVEGGVVLRGITLVDIYQRPDDIDHKQVTIRISAINYERTMTDAEITLLLDQLSSVAKDKLNAERI